MIESLITKLFAESEVVFPPIIMFPETFKSFVMSTDPKIVPPEDEYFVFAVSYAEFA